MPRPSRWKAVLLLGLLATALTAATPPPAAEAPSPAADPERQEADAFAQKALEALRAAGAKGELRYEPEHFRILIPEAPDQPAKTVHLTNFHADYRAAPPERRPEVHQLLTRILNPPKAPTTYAQARPHLLPVIRPRSYFELLGLADTGHASQAPFAVWRPLGEVFAVALVHDAPDTMQYLGPDQLSQWGVSTDKAFADAMDNLRRQSQEPLVTLAPGLCTATWEDSYASSRVLLEEVIRRCKVRGEPVVLLPNRDVLLLTGSEDEQGLLEAAQRAQAALESPRPMDGRALRRSPKGWLPFLPPRSSKAWAAFRKLHVLSLAREYEDQRQHLMSAQEPDAFIASFKLYENKQGHAFSMGIWVKDLETLLPKVDLISFIADPEPGPGTRPVATVRWELVERDAGKLLSPVPGLYPVRYRLQGFPSAEQLARWKKDPTAMDLP
jgi:hypothetical protein